MQHDLTTCHRRRRDRGVSKIPLDELCRRGHIRHQPGNEVVHDAHAVAAIDQLGGKMRADEAGAAGYPMRCQIKSEEFR